MKARVKRFYEYSSISAPHRRAGHNGILGWTEECKRLSRSNSVVELRENEDWYDIFVDDNNNFFHKDWLDFDFIKYEVKVIKTKKVVGVYQMGNNELEDLENHLIYNYTDVIFLSKLKT